MGVFSNQVPCAYCKQPPQVADMAKQTVYCATEGCPCHLNEVTMDVWCDRGPHEKAVMMIPVDEPIFILRGQDPLALVPIYTWIDLAEKKHVNEEKVNRAAQHAEEFQSFQRGEPDRMKQVPD